MESKRECLRKGESLGKITWACALLFPWISLTNSTCKRDDLHVIHLQVTWIALDELGYMLGVLPVVDNVRSLSLPLSVLNLDLATCRGLCASKSVTRSWVAVSGKTFLGGRSLLWLELSVKCRFHRDSLVCSLGVKNKLKKTAIFKHPANSKTFLVPACLWITAPTNTPAISNEIYANLLFLGILYSLVRVILNMYGSVNTSAWNLN